MTNIDYMNKLPNEILQLILTCLVPIEELIFVSLVCKKWCALIERSPISIQKVVRYYTSLDSEVSIILLRNIINDDEQFFCRAFFRNASSQIINWSLPIIQHLSSQVHENATLAASKGGNMRLLLLLKDQNILIHHYNRSELQVRTQDFSSIGWARRFNVKWNGALCAYAAMGGHLDIIKWARSIGCQCDRWTCSSAAAKNHLHIIKYATDNGCGWDSNVLVTAARYGSIDVLKWAFDSVTYWDHDYKYDINCSAVNFGHLEVLKWLKAINCHCFKCPWGEYTFLEGTIYSRQYEIAKWLAMNECPWPTSDDFWDSMELTEDIEQLKFIKANGGPWNERLQSRLELLQTNCS